MVGELVTCEKLLPEVLVHEQRLARIGRMQSTSLSSHDCTKAAIAELMV